MQGYAIGNDREGMKLAVQDLLGKVYSLEGKSMPEHVIIVS